jgi:hypothetical protein
VQAPELEALPRGRDHPASEGHRVLRDDVLAPGRGAVDEDEAPVLVRPDGVLRQAARDPRREQVVDVRHVPVPEEALPRGGPVRLADVEVGDGAVRPLVDPPVEGAARLAGEEVCFERDPVRGLDRDRAENGDEDEREKQEVAARQEGEREQ